MKERALLPFQLLVVTYTRLFPEYAEGQTYDDVPRDWRDAKLFMEHKDWNSEQIELRLRERIPVYLQDTYWQQHNFPAFGLFTQWNKFSPSPVIVPKRHKEIKSAMLLCDCGRQYAMNTICDCQKLTR